MSRIICKKYHKAYAEDSLSHCPNVRWQIFIELYKTENLFSDLQFCLNSHSKILGISESYCFYRNYEQARQPLFIKKAVQDIHIPWLDLLNTENLYFDSIKPLKNMPHYVVSYEGQFHYVTIQTMFR